MSKDNKERIEELLRWLRQHDIVCTAAKLHRKFSDGVVLATILKRIYPRLVELHNYSPQSSIRLKFSNWETLNAKVLSKLGMPQTKSSLENLAKGEMHAIEVLLLRIMKVERDRYKKSNGLPGADSPDNLLLTESQKLTVTINKKIGDALVKVPQEMVLYSVYENVVREIERKAAIVSEMKAKIEFLEADIEVLKCRIINLMDQEEKMLTTRMATWKLGNVMGLLDTRRVKQNPLTKISNTHPYSGYKELTPSICSETTSLPIGMEVPNTIGVHDTIQSHKAADDALYLTKVNNTNTKSSKVTKIPTLNGQALKSIREISKLPPVKAHEDANSLGEKPTTIGGNNNGIAQRNHAKNHSHQFESVHVARGGEFLTSIDTLNRYVVKIKSPDSIMCKTTAIDGGSSLVSHGNHKLKSHDKYNVSNQIAGPQSLYVPKTEIEYIHDLPSLTTLKLASQKSKTETKSITSKKVPKMPVENRPKTNKPQNDKTRLTSPMNEKYVYIPEYDDNPYLPSRTTVEEEMTVVNV